MSAILTAYGAVADDRRGYRQLWHALECTKELRKQLIVAVDGQRFSDTQALRSRMAAALKGAG